MELIEQCAEFPRPFRFLFEPWRYKCVYGGRGKGASWNFARALLILGIDSSSLGRPPGQAMRILCARETQKSIADSVHKLLADQIREMGLGSEYEVHKAAITGRPRKDTSRTEFTFAGLAHNVHNIKSLESYDILWVEEAQTVSDDSWEKVIPTIRREDSNGAWRSEIWACWNPELDTDATHIRFVVNPPPEYVIDGRTGARIPWAKIVRLSWCDNPFFPEVLQREREEMLASDPDTYDHVYEGSTRSTLKGAIYKAQIQQCDRENRITDVPYDLSLPVRTFWDLGWSDFVSIWFVQRDEFRFRFIDYHQDRYQDTDHYLQVLQSKGYTYTQDPQLPSIVWPWDAASKMNHATMQESVRKKGFNLRMLPSQSRMQGIDAVRRVFPRCWFDKRKCAEGIQWLRRYQWGEPSKDNVARSHPLHDPASHPADALRTFAMDRHEVLVKPPTTPQRRQTGPTTYRPFA